MSKLRGREQYGTLMGVTHGFTVGTGWSDKGAQDLYSMTQAALSTGDVVSYVVIKSRATTATLYWILRPGGTIDVARAFRLSPGESFNPDIYGIQNGLGVQTISLQGSASPTTVDMTVWYEKA